MILIQSLGIDFLQIQIYVVVKLIKVVYDWCYIYVLNIVMLNLMNYFVWIINYVVLFNRKQLEVFFKSEQVGRCVFFVKLNDCFGVFVYFRVFCFFVDIE